MSADLIAKLEAATEGSRELDFYLARVLGWHGSDDYTKFSWLAHPSDTDGSDAYCDYPRFTASFEDALTLLPTWASFELTQSAAGPPTFTRCRLWDWRRSPTGFDPANEWKSEGNRPLALNVCIAALRAVAA